MGVELRGTTPTRSLRSLCAAETVMRETANYMVTGNHSGEQMSKYIYTRDRVAEVSRDGQQNGTYNGFKLPV